MKNVNTNFYPCEDIEGLRYYSSDGERSFIILRAGKQHDGETWIKYYHVIETEHAYGSPNGIHKVLDEFETVKIIDNL